MNNASEQRIRVVVVAHGHPRLSVGGAEVAAYNLFRAYQEHTAVEKALFLARREGDPATIGNIRPFAADEYLLEQSMDDWRLFRGTARLRTVERFSRWLRAMRPDVVHFHHYSHLGVELLRAVKQCLPQARVLLTLHEYLAICMNDGQMVKRPSLRMCDEASLDGCHDCFPECSRESIWLRKRWLLEHFASVDGFIAPSHFLADRYHRWGIEEGRITVIENVQRQISMVVRQEKARPPQRFGFFGQINVYKGVELLLMALERASHVGGVLPQFELHGANLEQQPECFRRRIQQLAEPLEARGLLTWAGSYEASELEERLAGVDWVVVPSIWWENSPMVIQEAFSAGRPVICSNIGGMAEKVSHNGDGLHVARNNLPSWVDTLHRAAGDKALWQRLHNGIRRPTEGREIVNRHLELINSFGRYN